ncbi:zinc finger protein 37 isoform X2 [Kryptolebias marmoratus]|uniref:zinc finger protein 37 isoform X2 n=1 Tax=Kryptolebias marmoratus TaxID=37003 RepID=UPI0018ACD573|nr:zinc finger protein 37 isoform X2 [Kryptolebias marmoratus]
MAASQTAGIKKEYPCLWLTTPFALKVSDKNRKSLVGQRALNKDLDQARNKTRVNIGAAFPRWRELREQKGFRNDAQLATFLLDCYHASCLPLNFSPPQQLRDDDSGKECLSVHEDEERLSPMEIVVNIDESDVSLDSDIDQADDGTSTPAENTADFSEEEETADEDCCKDDSDDEDYTPSYRAVKTKKSLKAAQKSSKKNAANTKPSRRPSETDEIQAQRNIPHQLGNQEKDVAEHLHQDEDDSSTPTKTPPNKAGAELNTTEEEKPETQEKKRNSVLSGQAKKTFVCSNCGKVFPRQNSLKRHLLIHSGERPFKCIICGKGFFQNKRLKTHMNVHKGDRLPIRRRARVPMVIPPEFLKMPKEKVEYRCSVCGKKFPHAYGLDRHTLTHTGEKPYCCSICGRGFNQKGNLKTHYKVHLELTENLKSLSGEPRVQLSTCCLECGKDCGSQSALQAHHITTHSETVPESEEQTTSQFFFCRRCRIQFDDRDKMEEHMKTHIKEKPYSCPDCGKRFINESYIQIHQRIHTGEKPFLCSQCGKGFLTASSLKLHETQHSGERPFACSICGKAFQANSYLNAHYRTHIKSRPFICNVCGKSYSRAEELRDHNRHHTGERPFKCGKCGKSFIYRQGLRQHQRSHAGRRVTTRQLGRPKQQAKLDV